MGLVEVRMEIANPQDLARRASVTLLADTGATYSLIPRTVLERIGVTPMKRAEFEIADGRHIERDLGEVAFFWDGEHATSRVIFGEEGDAIVLGVHALEGLALQVDPYTKQLRPAKLILY